MPLSLPPNHPASAPRLDVHNINIDKDSTAAGECGTLHLADGWICHLPKLHRDGCAFQPPAGSASTQVQA